MSGRDEEVKIAVIGVGGCGCNAVKMIEEEARGDDDSVFKNSKVKIIAANTDAQVLAQISDADQIQLGPKLTKGQGAGGNPDCGRDAAIESQIDINSAFEGQDMVFLTAGMGGGTGTGAAPVIAGVAKRNGILTVGIVTKPFSFEGDQKMRSAEAGIDELRKNVDALLIVPNDTLIDIAGDDADVFDMFKKPNEILVYAVRSISELIINPGVVNIDFADIRNTMHDMGDAVIGFGTATGEHAPLNAVKEALNNPLLKNFTIEGSKRMLAYINGSMKMKELNEAADYLKSLRDQDAEFKFGLFPNPNKTDVSVLIITEAHEVKHQSEPKKANDTSRMDTPGTVLTERVPEDLLIEVQKPASDKKETIAAPLQQSLSANSQSVDIKDAKPFSFKDEAVAVFVPENSIDQNDKSIPAVLRRQGLVAEQERIQVSLNEYMKK